MKINSTATTIQISVYEQSERQTAHICTRYTM